MIFQLIWTAGLDSAWSFKARFRQVFGYAAEPKNAGLLRKRNAHVTWLLDHTLLSAYLLIKSVSNSTWKGFKIFPSKLEGSVQNLARDRLMKSPMMILAHTAKPHVEISKLPPNMYLQLKMKTSFTWENFLVVPWEYLDETWKEVQTEFKRFDLSQKIVILNTMNGFQSFKSKHKVNCFWRSQKCQK